MSRRRKPVTSIFAEVEGFLFSVALAATFLAFLNYVASPWLGHMIATFPDRLPH